MASHMTTEPPVCRIDDDEEQYNDFVGEDSDDGDEVEELVRTRVSRFAVEGDGNGGEEARRRVSRFAAERDDGGVHRGGRDQHAYKIGGNRGGCGVRSKKQEDDSPGGRTLPPPHAWLAVEDTKKSYGSDTEEQWARLLRGGAAQTERQPRRSSFSVVRRERVAREAWLDRAWEMKKSWHERNGGAPDADTPVVVVVGKGPSSPSSSSHHAAAGAVGGGGVAMDMEEVRACRELGFELPSDCSVEIQCYGLSAGSSPTHTASSSGGSNSPSAGSCSIPSPGEDPVDVKARLKVWAQAVALASTTHLGS